MLLEVLSDRYLFTNFGDGALQFWITPEDLKAMWFDKTFMTTECTDCKVILKKIKFFIMC